MARAYEMKRRADRAEETRTRIVEATIALHRTIGPARTTVTEIAERAGVGRVTVYRHFPDEMSLSRACSGSYFARNPLPGVDGWRAIEEPLDRLRTALRETLAWHDANAEMIGRALADARDHPVMAPYHRHWAEAARVLAAGWRATGGRAAERRAGIALALSFDSYRTLVREQGLSIERAARLLERLVVGGAGPRGGATGRE
jgi:AcrR family transcriptional regulator